MASTIAAANWCEWFLKTIPKILRTFFTDTLETHQFAAVEFTLNQRLLTKVNCSCLDKAQNLPVEKIINADFFPLEFVNGGLQPHSSEKRGLRSTFLSSEMLQNLPDL